MLEPFELHRPSLLSECGIFSVEARDGKPVVRFSVHEDERRDRKSRWLLLGEWGI